MLLSMSIRRKQEINIGNGPIVGLDLKNTVLEGLKAHVTHVR
jgi:hypothetical protein